MEHQPSKDELLHVATDDLPDEGNRSTMGHFADVIPMSDTDTDTDDEDTSDPTEEPLESSKPPFTMADAFRLLDFTIWVSILVDMILNKPIPAIKSLREATSCSLAQAKGAIDSFAVMLGICGTEPQILFARNEAGRLRVSLDTLLEREQNQGKLLEQTEGRISLMRQQRREDREASQRRFADEEAEKKRWKERAYEAANSNQETLQQIELLEQLLHSRLSRPKKLVPVEKQQQEQRKRQQGSHDLSDMIGQMFQAGACDGD